MENPRNLILAIVLSALVLIGWTFLQKKFVPPAAAPSTVLVDGKQVPLPTPEAAPDSAAQLRDRALVLRETPRVEIRTPRLAGTINLKGARLDDLVLLSHRETIAKNSPPVRLLSPGGATDAYFAAFGWTGAGALPGADVVWTPDSNLLAPGKPVTLSWNNGQGQIFRLRFSVDDNYMFTVAQSVTNSASATLTLKPYGLISRVGESKDPSSWTMHTGPIGAFNGATDYSVNFSDIDKAGPAGPPRFNSTGGWIGFGDKYWQTALVPAQNAAVDAGFRAGDGGRYQADAAGAVLNIAPGQTVSAEQRFFAGAKEVAVLDAYEAQGVTGFDRAIDWGWFVWFEKPIFYLLDWLFRHIGNFGVAIMCLTIIVRALLFPVAQRQFASMASMRKVQPKMKELQERHKEDKPRLQQEMMQLYKTEKVNPLAGCLPIFIQMPIFIALYKVLMLSIEMRHQPFTLWIRDLSAPDPLTPINLFGYLPFQPPGMLHLGVLAILLGITMWLQFRMNPAQMDPAQQQIMSFMPWMMMLFFAPLAAGLQLYYVVNNLLSLAQQQYLYARTPGLKESVATAK